MLEFKMQRDHRVFKTLVITKWGQVVDPAEQGQELLYFVGYQVMDDSAKHLIQEKWMEICHLSEQVLGIYDNWKVKFDKRG